MTIGRPDLLDEPAKELAASAMGRTADAFRKDANRAIGAHFRGDDKYNQTAIFRWRTGAPAVRFSAASMMALASMP